MLEVKKDVSQDTGHDEQTGRNRIAQSRLYRKTIGVSTAGVMKDEDKNKEGAGLKISRIFTSKNRDPFDSVEWEYRKASITDDSGKVVFEQDKVEVPKSWSMLATNVVASKYFYGGKESSARENSIRQVIHRVTRTIADWGMKDGYFASVEDKENFYSELSYICLNQYASFNSPVWFNVGLHHVYGYTATGSECFVWDPEKKEIIKTNDSLKNPQGSACFIQSVKDTMEDIMRLAVSEAMLFKHGSGTGTDLSTLRSSKEKLSSGGKPSGPLSFMRVYDQIAAVVKSGGKTRRAAKMQSLKVYHPDILEFVECKVKEEKKAWALIEQGYDGSFGGEAYDSVMFQNANLSVRVTDEFMRAVENDGEYYTIAVTTGKPVQKLKAREVMHKIAEAAHLCGDPGLQYDTTINNWHTCANDGRINASNPCSEFMFLDNSACNLASINLMKFIREDSFFDINLFKHVVRLLIIAQDILVDNCSYPTSEIASNSHVYRPLGLGYANLGAVLMRLGLPYDSDKGRLFASVVTALMTGQAYASSAEMAKILGPFEGYERNKDCMAKVINKHKNSFMQLERIPELAEIFMETEKIWDSVCSASAGFRNSQVTLLAPTGTIGFMMDCDTTGVEPDIALIKYKQLAGGGLMKIVNKTIPCALKDLGYNEEEINDIISYLEKNETIEGAPHLKQEHLPVFDCAFKPKNGSRFISYKAHLRMMAAVQPFLSGAISKTVNLPNETTVDEIMQVFIDGWEMGLKAVAVYRDGSKRTQPLSVGKKAENKDADNFVPGISDGRTKHTPMRRRMAPTRFSITHKFEIAGHEGYLTVGMYEDGRPGELFITMAKEGSTVGGMMDAFGTAISLCLQYGVPLQELCQKFSHSRFEPSGFTKNPDIPMAKSIVDYIFRWLETTFPGGVVAMDLPKPIGSRTKDQEKNLAAGEAKKEQLSQSKNSDDKKSTKIDRIDTQFQHFMDDAPACDVCGAITVRNGACYRCYNCGNSMGCS